MSSTLLAAPPLALVLDTNAVLDWLLFVDPGILAAAAAIDAGEVRWIACLEMRDELAQVLGRSSLVKWLPDSERVLAAFDRYSSLMPAPPSLPDLRCDDADDQVFIDLAVAHGARWLISHDRALLRLARRAKRVGLEVVKPAQWRL